MKKLSTGDDSTLGNWLKLSEVVCGVESKATKFLEGKIKESSSEEEVVVDEGQFLLVLMQLHMGDNDD